MRGYSTHTIQLVDIYLYPPGCSLTPSPTARRNFVFCGDIVPRLVGNTAYIRTILTELEKESKGNFVHNLGLAVSKNFIGDLREQFKAKVAHSMSPDGLLMLLSNYSHCSQLIYYQEKKTLDDAKYKFDCTLMSAEQFTKQFPENTKHPWGLRFTNTPGISTVLLKANLVKTGSSQLYHNPESCSKKKVLASVTDYLKDVHTVLPFASECSLLSSHTARPPNNSQTISCACAHLSSPLAPRPT